MAPLLPYRLIAMLCLSSLLGCGVSDDLKTADFGSQEPAPQLDSASASVRDRSNASRLATNGQGVKPTLPLLLGGEEVVAKVEVLDVGETRYNTWSGEPASGFLGQGQSLDRYQIVDFKVLEVLHSGALVDSPNRLLAPAWVAPTGSPFGRGPTDLASALFEVGDVGYIAFAIAGPTINHPYQEVVTSGASTQTELSGTLVRSGTVDDWWEVLDGAITGAIYDFDFQSESELRSRFSEAIGVGQ